jgi:hypothetical protein
MSLLPPSEACQFADRKAIVETLQTHARNNGYAITVQRFNPQDGVIYFQCDRGGQYKARHGLNDSNRLCDTGTRLTGCPFPLRANLKDSI